MSPRRAPAEDPNRGRSQDQSLNLKADRSEDLSRGRNLVLNPDQNRALSRVLSHDPKADQSLDLNLDLSPDPNLVQTLRGNLDLSRVQNLSLSLRLRRVRSDPPRRHRSASAMKIHRAHQDAATIAEGREPRFAPTHEMMF